MHTVRFTLYFIHKINFIRDPCEDFLIYCDCTGIRSVDEEITYLDVANHVLLVINAAFNILFHQREVQYIPKFAKQLVHELINLSNYLKYTGTGDAVKQLSPYLVQLVQQFESYIDDAELLAKYVLFTVHERNID